MDVLMCLNVDFLNIFWDKANRPYASRILKWLQLMNKSELTTPIILPLYFFFYRSSHASGLSSWLQSLRWKFRQQWQQDRLREGLWLLWASSQCLGGQEPSRFCFCRIWRPQRCYWCSSGTWWTVSNRFNGFWLKFVVWLHVAFVNGFSFIGHCVDVVCESSIPVERREAAPVAFLHHGADAPESEMTTGVVVPLLDEGGTQ